MNPNFDTIVRHGIALAFLLPSAAVAQDDAAPKAIHEMPLDERRVYALPVSIARVTTVSFPGPIAAIDAALVSTDEKTQGLFQLAHQPGTNFFSVRSLSKNATTNINVRWNNKTYVLEIQDSTAPVLSLIFHAPRDPRLVAIEKQKSVTPAMLLSTLDLAKAYPLLRASDSDVVKNIFNKVYAPKPPVMDHGDFEILLEEAYRFDAQDTMVFRVTLRNKTNKEIRYDPSGFLLRVGENRFNSSISDASGSMPAKKDTTAYFAVTGTGDGGRNDLSIENDFVIVLEMMTPVGVLPDLEPGIGNGGSK